MASEHLHPASLPPGTRLGPWRLMEPLGRGAYGVVYRAVAHEGDASDTVALKLALHPGNVRFPREAELLSRLSHPAVPRLRGQGQWLSPTGACYAWLALELVDGTPLYDWASPSAPPHARCFTSSPGWPAPSRPPMRPAASTGT